MNSSPNSTRIDAAAASGIGPDSWRHAIDQLPLGVLILDQSYRIQTWNAWLAENTAIPEADAIGKTLADLFPTLDNPRFLWALEQVFATGSPQLLSQALNQFLIPVRIKGRGRHGLPLMQQRVQLSSLTSGDGAALALVSIMDVTDTVMRSSALTEMAQSLQETSNRDALTAVYNRRFMWEWLLQELKRAARERYPLACLMLDIDHFKRINDTHGHDQGDAVLTDFAKIVGGQLRGSDILVRYGGEEFVALLPKCDLAQGIERAWKIISTVRGAAMGTLKAGSVTCSVGISVYDPLRPHTGEDLLKMADKRLYEAKNAGRDCVFPQ